MLGAQAPKAVRSQKMDDVIFAGTATRPALGRAEVSITIDNSDGTLGVEFTEVTVTRVLFRTGDSEYAINGVPCRLLDVQELLSDAGVGRQQHVIVSQGQIDAVLNARPEDRRAIIEEAAGVLKFRKRKEKAERRLDATEANLLRVQDLLREVRRQLRPLERQAEAADVTASLVAELTEVKTYVAGREIASWRAKLESLAVDPARQRHGGVRAEVGARRARHRGDGDRGAAVGSGRERRERSPGAGRAAARAGPWPRGRPRRAPSLARARQGQLLDAGVVANLEADAARFRDELDAVVVASPRSSRRPSSWSPTRRRSAPSARRCSSAVAADATGTQAASAAAEVRGELRSVRGIARAGGRRPAAIPRPVRLARRHGATSSAEDEVRFRAECERPARSRSRSSPSWSVAEAPRAEAEAAHEARQSLRNDAADAASRWTARVEALQLALDAARARAGAERLAGVDGVLGTLLDLVEIDEGWEPAVEAALGEALTAVVVDDPAAGASRAHGAAQLRHQWCGDRARRSTRRAAARASVGDAVRPHVRSGRPGVEHAARRAARRRRAGRRCRRRGRRCARPPRRRSS